MGRPRVARRYADVRAGDGFGCGADKMTVTDPVSVTIDLASLL
jgi:hypothetical protein